MQVTITLTDKELKFLEQIIREDRAMGTNSSSLEDAIHECINRALYDESEVAAQDEGI